MGKPIAGQDQFPFTIGGYLVDGANIKGTTYVKSLYIYKQRSSDLYDLMDSNGTIYRFIRIVGYGQDGNRLNYFTPAEEIVLNLATNTFFIKVQDAERNIFSFVRLYQLNKIITFDGDYIFRKIDKDRYLSGVLIQPSLTTLQVGETHSFQCIFFPNNYYNNNGSWYINDYSDTNHEIPSKYSKIIDYNKNKATIQGVKKGLSILSFVPMNNKSLISHSLINVVDENVEIKYISAERNTPFNNNYVGDEWSVQIVTYPYDALILNPMEIAIDPDVEPNFKIGTTTLVSVSDNNKIYTFKSQFEPGIPEFYEYFPHIVFTMNEPYKFSCEFFYDICILSMERYSQLMSIPNKSYNIDAYMRKNTSKQLSYKLMTPYQSYPIISSDPEIATIDDDGIITTYDKEGKTYFYTHYTDLVTGEMSTVQGNIGSVEVTDEVYDLIEVIPSNVQYMFPNQSQEFSITGYRSGFPNTIFNINVDSLNNYATITDNTIHINSDVENNSKFKIESNFQGNYQRFTTIYSNQTPSIYIKTNDDELTPVEYIDVIYSPGVPILIKMPQDPHENVYETAFFVPKPYGCVNYELEIVSYDSGVIEIYEPDKALQYGLYNYGSVNFYLIPKGIGSTEIVVRSVHYPDVQQSVKVVVY